MHLSTQIVLQGHFNDTWALKALKHLSTWALEGHLGIQAVKVLGHSTTWGTRTPKGHLGTQSTWAFGHLGTRTLEGHLDIWVLETLYLADSLQTQVFSSKNSVYSYMPHLPNIFFVTSNYFIPSAFYKLTWICVIFICKLFHLPWQQICNKFEKFAPAM